MTQSPDDSPTAAPAAETALPWPPAHAPATAALPLDRSGGDLWASRGFALYRSRSGEPFERVTTIWPRLGPASRVGQPAIER